MVIPVPLRFSNAFLIKGEGAVLVDAGSRGEEERILRAMAAAGVEEGDVSLILHTHGHSDHAGSTAALMKRLSAPAAVHAADADMLRAGRNRPTQATSLSARLLLPFLDWRFDPSEPEVFLEDGMDLSAYGIEGKIIATPGHTAGSVSVQLASGELIAGDAMMGGYLAGLIRPHVPRDIYFAEDLDQLKSSTAKIAALSPATVYVGHGGPLAGDAVARRFGADRR